MNVNYESLRERLLLMMIEQLGDDCLMKLKSISIIMCLGLVLAFSIALPLMANAEEKATLTLDQAITAALKNDFQVVTARNNLEKAKLAVRKEILNTYPQAVINDSLGQDLISGKSGNSLTITIKETYPTKFNLYGKKVPTAIETALWDQLSSELQLKITAANVTNTAVSNYINILKARQNLKLQESVVKNSQGALSIAQEQLKQGQITKPTELKAENDLANAQYTLEKNRSDYQMALEQLGNQIGIDDVSGLNLAEISMDQIPQQLDLAQLKTEAAQKRLELRQERINVQKAERQLAMDQNKTLPQLNFSYDYNNSDGTLSMNVNYGLLSGDITGNLTGSSNDSNISIPTPTPGLGPGSREDPNKQKNTFTLNMTWNLDFGTAKNQAQQSKITLENAQNSEKEKLEGVLWELQQAHSNFVFALKKAELNEDALPFYQKQLEIKRLQVKIGTATQLELAQTETDLLQAQVQLVNARYDLMAAYKKVQLSAGELYPQTENI